MCYNTCKWRLKNIRETLGVHTHTAAMLKGLQMGLILMPCTSERTFEILAQRNYRQWNRMERLIQWVQLSSIRGE